MECKARMIPCACAGLSESAQIAFVRRHFFHFMRPIQLTCQRSLLFLHNSSYMTMQNSLKENKCHYAFLFLYRRSALDTLMLLNNTEDAVRLYSFYTWYYFCFRILMFSPHIVTIRLFQYDVYVCICQY